MATRKTKKVAGPSVVKGTHLTVTTDENGKTTLEWDDEQLLKEVREAIASVTPASKKSKKFNYSEPKKITTENGDNALQVTVTKKTPAKKTKTKKQ